jgi:hypothetical protein
MPDCAARVASWFWPFISRWHGSCLVGSCVAVTVTECGEGMTRGCQRLGQPAMVRPREGIVGFSSQATMSCLQSQRHCSSLAAMTISSSSTEEVRVWENLKFLADQDAAEARQSAKVSSFTASGFSCIFCGGRTLLPAFKAVGGLTPHQLT